MLVDVDKSEDELLDFPEPLVLTSFAFSFWSKTSFSSALSTIFSIEISACSLILSLSCSLFLISTATKPFTSSSVSLRTSSSKFSSSFDLGTVAVKTSPAETSLLLIAPVNGSETDILTFPSNM